MEGSLTFSFIASTLSTSAIIFVTEVITIVYCSTNSWPGHREPTPDILTKKWSETTKNSMRYDCLVSSLAREGAKSTRKWGRVGAKEVGHGGGGRVESRL